jgi:hypothetical protein
MKKIPLWLPAPAFCLAFCLAYCLAFNGCATTVYQPLDNGIGYSEVEVGKDRYEIMFHGTSDQDELAAKKYALVRAAEVGKRNGFTYFRVDNAKTREKEEKEVVRESQSRSVPEDPYYRPFPARRRRTETRTVTHTERRPVVKIAVTYLHEECPDCLSVDAKLQEAAGEGILKP